MARKRVATLDAETDPFKYGRTPEPFVWGLYLDTTFTYFWGKTPQECCEKLIDFLKDERDLVIYIHNGGKFDVHFLLEYLDQELMIINGRIAVCYLFGGAIEIRDSWLILPLPLSAHAKDDIDYNKMERENREHHRHEIIEYLKTDCVSLYGWVSEFIDMFGMNLTLAGTAFKELRKTEYEISRTHAGYDDTFRPFYYGGRVQCFEVGSFSGPVEYVDINSAYPYAMTHRHWYGTQYCEKLKLPDNFEELNHASYFVDLEAKSYGALPLKVNEKLYFPDDGKRRRFRITGHELMAGLKTDTLKIEKIRRVYMPLFTQDFREYVDKFFAMKHEADVEMKLYKGVDDYLCERAKTKRQFAKLMLNSCYGKFGQDGRKFEKYCLMPFGEWPVNDPTWPHDMRWAPYADGPNGSRYFARPDPQHSFFNVATAASVTGLVRAYLWESICNSDRPLYCDTDSIMCGKFNGVISDELGAWDREAELSEVHIAQRKMYAGKTYKKAWPFVDYKVASKGVRFSDSAEESFFAIRKGVKNRQNVELKKESPAFSLKYGARFFKKEVKFSEIEKNACNNPPE